MLNLRKDIRQIPVEGGSGRYSSGAVEFKNAWPGIFIRGDDCISLLTTLETHRVQCKDKGIALPYDIDVMIECISDSVVVKG